MLRKSYKQAFTGILMRGCDFLLTRKWSSEVNTSRSTQPPFLVVLYLLQCTWVIVRSCCMFLFISHFMLFFAVTDSWNFISLPEALTRTARNTWAYSRARLNPSSATHDGHSQCFTFKNHTPQASMGFYSYCAHTWVPAGVQYLIYKQI